MNAWFLIYRKIYTGIGGFHVKLYDFSLEIYNKYGRKRKFVALSTCMA